LPARLPLRLDLTGVGSDALIIRAVLLVPAVLLLGSPPAASEQGAAGVRIVLGAVQFLGAGEENGFTGGDLLAAGLRLLAAVNHLPVALLIDLADEAIAGREARGLLGTAGDFLLDGCRHRSPFKVTE
jgi:hypothetical protein